MEELRHSLGSLIKIGSTSGSSAVLLASLLPPLLELTRADAASSSVNYGEGFSSETTVILGESVLQRARGFSLLTLAREELTSWFVRCNDKPTILLQCTIIVNQYV